MTEFAANFPILSAPIVHLNHCGVAPITGPAADVLRKYAADASTRAGIANREWHAGIQRAREDAAKIVGGGADEIAFVKSTTHGLLIVANSIDWKRGDAIVVDERTFPANWHAWKPLEERFGVRIVAWPERDHRYELADLERIVREHSVRLVSISAADFATGFCHDIAAIGRIAKGAGALYCLDAIQMLGARPVDARACGADFLSADGHKWMLGPEGAGMLYVRRESLGELQPWLCGWLGRANFTRFDDNALPPDPTARRFEEGATNVPGVLAFGASLALLNETGLAEVQRRLRANVGILRDGLRDAGWRLVSPDDDRWCGISSFSHPTIDPNAIVVHLAKHDIVATSRRGWLRLAPHFYQSADQMHRVAETVAAFR